MKFAKDAAALFSACLVVATFWLGWWSWTTPTPASDADGMYATVMMGRIVSAITIGCILSLGIVASACVLVAGDRDDEYAGDSEYDLWRD